MMAEAAEGTEVERLDWEVAEEERGMEVRAAQLAVLGELVRVAVASAAVAA